MPFGITVAPRVFTKLMAAVGEHLRSQQIHIFMYLDDWLVKNQIRELLRTSSIKSNNTTSGRSRIDNQFRQMPFSAFTDNYLSGCSFQPEQRVSSPLREQVFGNQPSNCRYYLQPPMSSFPFFTTFGTNGLMHRYTHTVPYDCLHMRPIQIYLLYFWCPHIDGLHFKIPVFPIMWWQQERNIFRGVPLQGYPHNKVLWTDASKWGWGAYLSTHQVAGQWPNELINHHINWLEMRAVWNALIEFQEEIQGENLLIRCDNATVVAYINKQGGTKSIPLCHLLWDMMQWCLKHNIHIHAAHIPGKKNCLADKLSRGQKLVRLTEWASNHQ